MDTRIQKILEDLYAIDERFRVHEVKLTEIVSELILSRPDTKFDEMFAARLRSELLETPVAVKAVVSPYMSFFAAFGNMKYALGGALVTILIIAPLTYFATRETGGIDTGFSLQQNIVEKGENAFGSLSQNINTSLPLAPSDRAASESANERSTKDSSGMNVPEPSVGAPTPASGVPMSISVPSSQTTPGFVGGKGGGSSGSSGSGSATSVGMPSPLIYPEMVTYTYTYAGQPIEIKESSAKVFKRIRNVGSGNELSGFLKNAKFGIIDLGKFSNLKVRNLNLMQEGNEGYEINIDFVGGVISINRYWQGKDIPVAESRGSGSKLEESQIIDIAKKFLRQYGIDTSVYSAPEVQQNPYQTYDEKAAMEFYIPYDATVTFPLTIDGMDVYDESGNTYGMQVVVNLAEKKVSGVYNLSSQSYERATYKLETDAEKILNIFNQMSNGGYGYGDGGSVPPPIPLGMQYDGGENREIRTRTEEIKLGTPERILMRYWAYDSADGSELYVPALLFPVTSTTIPNYWQKNITIPIVKEFLEKRNSPEVYPMKGIPTSEAQ